VYFSEALCQKSDSRCSYCAGASLFLILFSTMVGAFLVMHFKTVFVYLSRFLPSDILGFGLLSSSSASVFPLFRTTGSNTCPARSHSKFPFLQGTTLQAAQMPLVTS